MRASFAVSLVLLSAIASPARAYVRTTVDGFPERPIWWMDRSISVELASRSSADVTPIDLRSAFDRSLATWSGAGSCTDIVLTDVGEALGTTTNLDGGPLDHHNRVVVRASGWPAIVGPETLALTTILYERSSGAILDADTDLNAAVHSFSVGDPPLADHDDVQNTLTHELGHLLGFGHVSDPDATMYAMAAPGEVRKRDLAPDDVHAVCETYPTGAPTRTTLPSAPASCAVAAGAPVFSRWIALAFAVWLTRRAVRGSRPECPARRADTMVSRPLSGRLGPRSRRAARGDETAF